MGLAVKYNVSLRKLLQTEFYGDLVYRIRKLVAKSNFASIYWTARDAPSAKFAYVWLRFTALQHHVPFFEKSLSSIWSKTEDLPKFHLPINIRKQKLAFSKVFRIEFEKLSDWKKRFSPLDLGERPHLSHLMRLWYFSSSVNSLFKSSCAVIQWG